MAAKVDGESPKRVRESVSKALKLRCVGFCGADESFSPADESEYAWPDYVEWGVLFRPEKEGLPRFPREEYVARFVKGKARLAAHLCSSRCAEFLEGDGAFVRRLHEELGFKRFQINATKANNFDSAALSQSHVGNLVKAAADLPNAEFIVQRNEETKPLWEPLEDLGAEKPSNISYLFDASVGRGVVVSEFPLPRLQKALFGYAGGLKSENIEHVLRSICSALSSHDVSVWVDMESGIRDGTPNDAFDAKRAWAVCEVIDKLINEGVIEFV